jgi:predicted ATPase
MLVTSRVLLHLSGEHRFPVLPLSLPEPLVHPRPTQDDVEEIARSEAVQLFAARASAVQPGFAVTADNAAKIGAVCRQLDGLPLAIELAAARLRILSPEALLTDLEHRLRLLSDGPRDVPDRLRTMRNAIAWSVDRLSQEERSLFCRLGVFVGGFSLEAAEWMVPAVGGDGPTSPEPTLDTLDLVTSLVDHSLVQRVEQPGKPPRYQMLETIRAYALRELTSSGEEVSARHCHGAWATAFAERAEPELSGSHQREMVRPVRSGAA